MDSIISCRAETIIIIIINFIYIALFKTQLQSAEQYKHNYNKEYKLHVMYRKKTGIKIQ